MAALIAVLPGDGIGPEVTREAVRVLEKVADMRGLDLELAEAAIGGVAIEATGQALPDETAALCARADAVLLGAVGDPRWSDPEAAVRPEQGLLALRELLGVYANLRPVRPHPALFDASPIRADRLKDVDIMIVRELTGGIYFGTKTRTDTEASDLCSYTAREVERIVRVAAELARKRDRRLVAVDKANVLATSRLWRAVIDRLMPEEFPDVAYQYMLVDAAAMHLITSPRDFDVVVTENMFGDILTDEASVLAGSMGLLPSASLGSEQRGLYEPIHGSAPDIAGRDMANPAAAILSAAMLLRHTLGEMEGARAVEQAVERTIEQGVLTADLTSPGDTAVSTAAFADRVLENLGSD